MRFDETAYPFASAVSVQASTSPVPELWGVGHVAVSVPGSSLVAPAPDDSASLTISDPVTRDVVVAQSRPARGSNSCYGIAEWHAVSGKSGGFGFLVSSVRAYPLFSGCCASGVA